MTDIKELVKLCKARDPRAQRDLYDRYKSRLMGICRRYASGRDEAQDILQESFIKIFTRIVQLDDYERLESWMVRITINTAVNYYHQSKRFDFNDIAETIPSNGDYELILSNISDEFLISQINLLPDGCRVVFNLFVVEGYSHSEIAGILGIAESTSRSQLVYAKGLLKQKLNAAGIVRYERYA